MTEVDKWRNAVLADAFDQDWLKDIMPSRCWSSIYEWLYEQADLDWYPDKVKRDAFKETIRTGKIVKAEPIQDWAVSKERIDALEREHNNKYGVINL